MIFKFKRRVLCAPLEVVRTGTVNMEVVVEVKNEATGAYYQVPSPLRSCLHIDCNLKLFHVITSIYP